MVSEPLGPCAPSAFFCSFDSFTRMIGKNHQTLLELNWSQYTYYIFIVHHFLTSRPYHSPHPLARFTYHFDQVRVVWPSVSRYFHFQESYTLSVWSLVLCTHYRTGTVFLLRFGKRYAYTSKIFWTNFQIIQKFQIFRIQNSNKIDIFNKGRSKKKGLYKNQRTTRGGDSCRYVCLW